MNQDGVSLICLLLGPNLIEGFQYLLDLFYLFFKVFRCSGVFLSSLSPFGYSFHSSLVFLLERLNLYLIWGNAIKEIANLALKLSGEI